MPQTLNAKDIKTFSCVSEVLQQYADLIPKLVNKPSKLDTMRISILAMDCAYRDSMLSSTLENDSEAREIFNKNCVDVAGGEKVQIRLANPHTYFNVTNYMRFENIEFTGEDLFAEAMYNDKPMGFMDQWGILAFMPFNKCQVLNDKDSLTVIDEL